MHVMLDQILAEYPDARRAGDGFLISCPVPGHGKGKGDRDPSLSIRESDDGRLLVHCHAGCSQEDVLNALGSGGGVMIRPSGNGYHRGNGHAGLTTAHESSTNTNNSNWLWKSREMAHVEFGKLHPVRDDEQARAFLEADYGLASDDIPDGWREYDHPKHGPGIVYPGIAADGSPVFKYKSFARKPDNGKRHIVFLYGAGGALVMTAGPDRPLVIVAGEEKSVAARAAGFNALCPLTGEKALSDELIGLVLDQGPQAPRPPFIILASDHDRTGYEADLATAEKLERAGFPPDRIRVVAWPDDAPEGYDLNDVLKADGADAVRRVLESALPFESSLPRCLSATDFITVTRSPLVYHIDGILPYGGKLTFSATAKFGKSMWAIQTGLALAAGHCEWLGWKFGPPAQVLYLQAEIMDAMLTVRMRRHMETMPAGLDRERAGHNFIIQEIEKGRPILTTDHGRAVVEALLNIRRPDVLILDPLTALHPGLEENEASAMGRALDYIHGLTSRFGCAVILVHHHNKTGAARGSSVFEAWPESDLQASYLSDSDHSIAKITSRLRCIFNPGLVYWRMPTLESPWFMRMPDDWEPDRKGRKPSYQPTIAQMALKAAAIPMKYGELTSAIQNGVGCCKRTAQELIKEAKAKGLIVKEADFYVPCNPSPQKGLS